MADRRQMDTPHLTRVAPDGRSAPWLRPAGGARSAQGACKLPSGAPLSLQVTTPQRFGAAALEVLRGLLEQKPRAVVGFPTGRTPRSFYERLRRAAAAGTLPCAGLRAVMLDEYLGDAGEPFSFQRELEREIFRPLGLGEERVLRMSSAAGGLAAACRSFERRLALWGGCDLLFLGLGGNGHIAFNEPGATARSRTRLVTLTPATLCANTGEARGSLPRQAVTMGIATILEARHCCLLVRGRAKAEVLRAALLGPIGPALPASFLRRCRQLTILADTDAASALELVS
ncbi:MAG TPA: 6-phosphogluconolactonase [Terriglobales bacterium]|nr:6-phosphogluconolactonase [Terriglobales bacterium]